MTGYLGFPDFSDWRPDFDTSTLEAAKTALERARSDFGVAAVDAAVEVATRSAAVETGAIEGLYETTRGFTRTIAEMAVGWEQALHRRGTEVEGPVRDAFLGYDYLLDAVTGERKVSAHWIRELHAVLCRSQVSFRVHVPSGSGYVAKDEPLPKGQYKSRPNNPTRASGQTFHYAPPERAESEVRRLEEQLSSDEFRDAPTILQAAYAHYAFVLIHPFADGNGRVARALASVYLYRMPGVPLVIFSDQRDAYLDALEKADTGDAAALARFFELRTVESVQLVQASIRRGDAMADLEDALSGEGFAGTRDVDVELVVRGLVSRLLDVAENDLSSRQWPGSVAFEAVEWAPGLVTVSDPEWHSTHDIVEVRLRAEGNLGEAVSKLCVLRRLGGTGPALRLDDGLGNGLDLNLEDVFPRLNDYTLARLRSWVSSVIDATTSQLAQTVRTARALGLGTKTEP